MRHGLKPCWNPVYLTTRELKKQGRFPALAGLDAVELKALLKRSTLSREDRQIAISCLIWDMAYADIGAAVHMDRTTVSRRMRNVIAPQLERLMEKQLRSIS